MHGALVAPTLHHSTLLRVVFLVIGGVGILAYAYRAFLARFVIPIHDYTVAEVRRPNPATLEVSLDPAREPLGFVPGQFVWCSPSAVRRAGSGTRSRSRANRRNAGSR